MLIDAIDRRDGVRTRRAQLFCIWAARSIVDILIAVAIPVLSSRALLSPALPVSRFTAVAMLTSRLVWLLLLGLSFVTSGFSASAEKESPVVLPSYKVVASPLVALGVSTRLRTNFFSGKVSQLTVTRVSPGSVGAKAGLKVGDEIVGLRGRAIAGLTRSELIELGKILAGGELPLSLRVKDDPAVREIVLKMPARVSVDILSPNPRR